MVQLSTDIPAVIVYGASGREVQTVLIDGGIVVHDRVVLTTRDREILANAAKAREELYCLCGWRLEYNKSIPPTTSWLERYPNKRIAKSGARLARLHQWSQRPKGSPSEK